MGSRRITGPTRPAAAAARWWAEQLRYHNRHDPGVDAFEQQLAELIRGALAIQRDEIAGNGRACRRRRPSQRLGEAITICFDARPPDLLERAGERAGVDGDAVSRWLPHRTWMKIGRYSVQVRPLHSATGVQQVWPAPRRRWLPLPLWWRSRHALIAQPSWGRLTAADQELADA